MTEEEEDSCGGGDSVHGRGREVEADSGISRTTDDSLRNDDSSLEELIDTSDSSAPTATATAASLDSSLYTHRQRTYVLQYTLYTRQHRAFARPKSTYYM